MSTLRPSSDAAAQDFQAQLQQQTRLQNMLMDISSTYISMPVDNLNQSINSTLGAIGRFVTADRVYIFNYDFDAQTCSNTYEWCEHNISPEIESLQDIPLSMVPEWVDTHLKGDTMYVPNVLALPPDSGTRLILEPQHIKSLIAVPMMDGPQCLGFVGLDSVRQHYHYTQTEQRLLLVFAQMLVNVFKRRDVELALRQATEQAQASSKAKSDFLANMSHEIRTPLNAVIGFTELLLGTPLTPTQQAYVRQANASGQALLGIINDILDLSKIEARQLTLELTESNLLDTIEQAHSMVQHLLDQRQPPLPLSITHSPQLPAMAKFDALRLKQVLVNLLNNAIKFTEQGHVELRIDFTPLPGQRGRYGFSVRDTGIGISPEQRLLLFKAFAQADNSITRRFGGTGLGLVISQQLVQKMGGQLDFHSTLGQGTTFMFDIELELASPPAHATPTPPNNPANSLAAPALPPAHLPPQATTPRPTVLVVDDVLPNRLLIHALLLNIQPHLHIVEAGNGQESIDMLRTTPVDLVLMDVHMPTMDGLTATRHIRALPPPMGAVPIVALTASSAEEERQRCLLSGMNDFLTKPIRPKLLAQALQLHLPQLPP